MELLSGQNVRRFLLVVYSIFIGMGLLMVSYGIYMAATTNIDLEDVNGTEVNGVTAIFGGLADIAIGILGILGILQNRRILLILITGMLAGAIVMNMLILVVTVTATNSVSKASSNNIRDRITVMYGENSDPLAQGFTLDIDNHQDKAQCCGFSGDESENLFLKTPWYKNVNVNVDKKRTLPDSCCVEAGEKCREVEDLKEAREKKYVYEYDCLTQLNNKASLNMWLTVFQMLSAVILQGVCVAATVMRIMNPSDSE